MDYWIVKKDSSNDPTNDDCIIIGIFTSEQDADWFIKNQQHSAPVYTEEIIQDTIQKMIELGFDEDEIINKKMQMRTEQYDILYTKYHFIQGNELLLN